ncbi:MAG: hypothetical protein AAF673_00995 [Pseudomonadota bacterium]
MSLSVSDAADQLADAMAKAGVEVTSNINSIINEQLTRKVVVLGKRENRHEIMCEQVKLSLERIIENNKEKLGPHAEKLCEIIENTAPTPEAKESLQTSLASTKAQYMDNAKAKDFGKSLDLVQETVTNLGNSKSVRNLMGDAHADKFADMTKKMNDRLKGVTDQGKRADLLVKEIDKMNKYVENAEKQASKGKFGKIMNVLKSALKVIATLGLSKSAKLELSAAKFSMDNKNAEKIKAGAKSVSKGLKASAQVATNAKKINSNKGMGR